MARAGGHAHGWRALHGNAGAGHVGALLERSSAKGGTARARLDQEVRAEGECAAACMGPHERVVCAWQMWDAQRRRRRAGFARAEILGAGSRVVPPPSCVRAEAGMSRCASIAARAGSLALSI